ncbi:hypothetical protein EYF80_049507 [Liparis tanakae]|uniref:Uncharacterized protein n=1 Tax=Liparis tanakae TaxID=230148 RepID=A0A4Z2FGM5_9TELE|nr:hypothetical protein EYF80_049507 [Liparis tanakae]
MILVGGRALELPPTNGVDDLCSTQTKRDFRSGAMEGAPRGHIKRLWTEAEKASVRKHFLGQISDDECMFDEDYILDSGTQDDDDDYDSDANIPITPNEIAFSGNEDEGSGSDSDGGDRRQSIRLNPCTKGGLYSEVLHSPLLVSATS